MDYFEKLERLRAAYVTLELPHNVTSKEEIRKAYKNLALKHHPDKGGALGAFQKVKVAYDVRCTSLSTPTASHFNPAHTQQSRIGGS
jgi:DnaJ-class molecular chaperone